MPSTCGKLVKNAGIVVGKIYGFYSPSTNSQKYLTSQVFSIPKVLTFFKQAFDTFTLSVYRVFKVLVNLSSTFSPIPNNEAKNLI